MPLPHVKGREGKPSPRIRVWVYLLEPHVIGPRGLDNSMISLGLEFVFEECTNQCPGVLGGRVWQMFICHLFLSLCFDQGLGDHGLLL